MWKFEKSKSISTDMLKKSHWADLLQNTYFWMEFFEDFKQRK